MRRSRKKKNDCIPNDEIWCEENYLHSVDDKTRKNLVARTLTTTALTKNLTIPVSARDLGTSLSDKLE